MKRSVKSLIGFTIGAIDGEVGKVKDFYFDDTTWSVQYLVVETGNWLSERKVLIAPQTVTTPDWETKTFPVDLTMEQVKNSPDIDTNKPVSKQQELELYKYYPHSGFWGGGLLKGDQGVTDKILQMQENIKDAIPDDKKNPHLRSTGDVIGYKIKASDGEIGEVEDFIIEDEALTIRYIIVDTGNWFPGKKVIISPKWANEIKWDTAEVVLNLTVEQVKNSPEYDYAEDISDTYEAALINYYGRFNSGIK